MNIDELFTDLKQLVSSPERTKNMTETEILSLEISSEKQADIWQEVAKRQSNDVARWNAYINYLGLDGFREILSQEIDLNEKSLIISPLPELSSLWEFFNGTKIRLENTNIVLIPSEASNFAKLEVPQEWIDIPTLAAQYYVALQVNLEDQWIQVLGVTTHQTLKQDGQYDLLKRIYSLDCQHLFSLNVMFISQKLHLETSSQISSLPKLSADLARTLLEKLGKPTPYSPRLELPFAQWGALLENEQWRTALYQKRQASLVSVLPRIQEWLKRNFAEAMQVGWTPELTPVFRTTNIVKQSLIDKLQLTQDEREMIAIAEKLGEIEPTNSEAIQGLIKLIQTTADETNRWDAALVLGRIVPHHPSGAICCYKMIKLGSQQLKLRLAARKEVQDTVTILLQPEVLETEGENSQTMLQNLLLTVVDESGNCVKTAHYGDFPLQLTAELGETFSLQLTLGEFTIQENLAI